MDINSAHIFEDESVLSKATRHPAENTIEHSFNGKITIAGKEYKNYCNCNFLGFGDAELKQAAANASSERVITSSCGKSITQNNLENNLAWFTGYEKATVFSSYNALTSDIFEALLNNKDAVIFDENINYSLLKGIRLCKTSSSRFAHNDISDLEKQLIINQGKRLRIIVTQGIFSVKGDCADVKEILRLARSYNAVTLIDDSFGLGTCGKSGIGTDEFFGLTAGFDIKICSMQNALCCSSGAFVASDKNIIDLILLRSKSYKTDLSMSESNLFKAFFTLEEIKKSSLRADKMRYQTDKIYNMLKEKGLNPFKSIAGIVSYTTDKNEITAMEEVKSLGFVCPLFKTGKTLTVSMRISAV